MTWEKELDQKYTKKEVSKLKKSLKKFKSHGQDEWYNALGIIMQGHKFKPVYKSLKELYKTKDVYKTSLYQDIHADKISEADHIVNPPNITESNETCLRCKTKKVIYYQKQTRSCDEPITTFFTCTNCGKSWKVY